MANEVKEAFESIKSDELLKLKTIAFLQLEIERKRKAKNVKRFFVSIACLFAIFSAGIFSYSLYYTKNGYIDVDINPAVELAINQFDRVVSIYAFNDDGERILNRLEIIHKTYNEAVSILLEALIKEGFVSNDGLLSVTVQLDDNSKADKVVQEIMSSAEIIVKKHHTNAQIDVFSVTREVRNDSYEVNLSPAKYLAIKELQQVHPEVTFDSCRHHSISDIKDLSATPYKKKEHSHRGGHGH